jgi:hypothetical protein
VNALEALHSLRSCLSAKRGDFHGVQSGNEILSKTPQGKVQQFWKKYNKIRRQSVKIHFDMFTTKLAAFHNCTKPSRRTLTNVFLLFICLTLCALLPSCVPSVNCTLEEGSECQYAGPKILNTRLEVVNQESLHPSNAIWLHAGDQLVTKWDSYTFELTYGSATCTFDNNFTEGTAGECELCNLCETDTTRLRQLCPSPHGFFGAKPPRIFVYEGFIKSDTPTATVLLSEDSRGFGGCSAYGYAPAPFTPAVNATYQVLAPEFSSMPDEELTKKYVFVVQNGMTQTTLYKMEQHTEANPTIVWYKWTVGVGPVWEDNFSANLRVGKIRVLKGREVRDPNTGRFGLDDMTKTVAHPSRIVLVPNFDSSLSVFNQDTNRCYADSSADGDINLNRCRTAFGNNTGFLFDVTPTYLKTQPADQLTWIVEFNPAEGGMPPVLAADETLAIEFTIEQVP